MADNDQLDIDTINRLEAFFPILVRTALKRKLIGYQALMDEGIRTHNVQRVVNTRIGRTLEWFRFFTASRKLPDICAIVVRVDTEQPGPGFGPGCGYSGHFEESRDACFACSDWKADDFPDFLKDLRRHVGKPRNEIKNFYCP